MQRVSKPLTPRLFFIFLATEGIDSLSRFGVIIWAYAYLTQCLHGQWVKASLYYGFLLSAMGVGRVLGQLGRRENGPSQLTAMSYANSTRYFNQILLLLMIASLLSLIYSNRFSFIVGSFFCIGFSGSCLQGQISFSSDRYQADGPLRNLKIRQNNPNSIYSNENKLKRSLVMFIFMVIISSQTYIQALENRRGDYIMFPAFYPCWALIGLCLFVSLYYSLTTRVTRASHGRSWCCCSTNASVASTNDAGRGASSSAGTS
jgi:hypothetical protein